jgi:hypothetical protein
VESAVRPFKSSLTGVVGTARHQHFKTHTDACLGGRTAWSCTIDIQGTPVQARFWYDGQYVNQAREDAAQVALERLGQIPRSGVNPTQQLQQSYQGTQNGDQQRSYTVNQR